MLSAEYLYSKYKQIPEGEEDFLFLYSIDAINDGCKTATIDYEGKYILEGGDEWNDYPPVDDEDRQIPNYRLELIKADHELYNIYHAKFKRKENNKKEAKKKRDEDRKKSALDDVTDIDKRFQKEGMKPHSILMLEFEQAGEEQEHVIGSGANMGKLSMKQLWSKYIFGR